jgi:hypothetical protein
MGSLSVDMPEFLQHTLIFEPYLGQTGGGAPAYGTAFSLVGFCDAKARMVRTQMTQTNTGTEALSEATFYTDRGPTVPVDSRVTLPSGRTSRVLAVLDRDGGSLPVPSHLEIVIA